MEKHMQARVILSPTTRKTLALDVYRRSRIEACGVLLGTMDQSGNWCIERAHPLENIFASPWVWLIITGPFVDATSAKHKGKRELKEQTSSYAGELAQDRVIAYHHYDKEGLQRVTVEFGEESMVTQDDTSSTSITS